MPLTSEPVTSLHRAWATVLFAFAGFAACHSGGRGGEGPGDPGPSCASGACNPPSGPAATEPDDIEPFPRSTFVFLRHVRTGAEWTEQLWARDMVSGEERLVSNLDDALVANDGQLGGGLAISPDRKWVAFSAYFRPSAPDDRSLGNHTRMIWKVSADGRRFVRLSPPLPDPRLPCSMGCPSFMTCQERSQKCTSLIWQYSYESPTWTPDGRHVWFALEEVTCDAATCINSPSTILDPAIGPPLPPPAASTLTTLLSVVDRPGSAVQELKLPPLSLGCDGYSPVVSPDGKRLAILLAAGCKGGTVLLTNLDGGNPEYLDYQRPACRKIAWSFDGAGVYCLPYRQEQIVLYLIAERQVVMLDTPQAPGFTIQGFAESTEGMGRWLVVALRSNTTKRSDLYMYDETNPTVWKRLTTDEASYRAAF